MNIDELNNLSPEIFREEMRKCCGSMTWVNKMYTLRPFLNLEDLQNKSDIAWASTNTNDWLEAFNHHPKIGDLKSLEKKFTSTKEMAGVEQSSVNSASKQTLEELAERNEEYENKFGFIFIVCATGKSADEMLQLLKTRIPNDRNTELKTAAEEQHKITKLRLNKITR